MDKNIIPIVFASNNNYAPYLAVALHSLISNVNNKYEYDIYIFYTTLDTNYKKTLKQMESENVKINFVNVEEWANNHIEEPNEQTNQYSMNNYLTVEATYRLFIPDILKKYEKVIYLDNDIVVVSDIAELYQIDLGDNILGAVNDLFNEFNIKYSKEILHIDVGDCINSGVLLINTEMFQKYGIKEKCFELLNEDWKNERKRFECMDQDVLNITCRGRVKFLEMEWNLLWATLLPDTKCMESYKLKFHKACENPKLIHYAGIFKPWQHPENILAKIFWKYARETEFYEEIVYTNIEEKLSQKINSINDNLEGKTCINEWFKTYIFPFDLIPRKSNVVIHGAGRVGFAFQKQVLSTSYCNLLLWTDKKYEEFQNHNLSVSSPENIKRVPYDYVVIAIENENIAKSVCEELIALGVERKKIVWTEPRNK